MNGKIRKWRGQLWGSERKEIKRKKLTIVMSGVEGDGMVSWLWGRKKNKEKKKKKKKKKEKKKKEKKKEEVQVGSGEKREK